MELKELLQKAYELGGSDIFIVPGAHVTCKVKGDMVPMTFIRAPYIMRPTTPDVQVLARVDGRIVAARQHHLLVTAFHPELDDDLRIHRLFLDIVRHNSKQCPA